MIGVLVGLILVAIATALLVLSVTKHRREEEPLVGCPSCGQSVPSWFMESFEHPSIFQAREQSSFCLRCMGSFDEYPELHENKAQFEARLEKERLAEERDQGREQDKRLLELARERRKNDP